MNDSELAIALDKYCKSTAAKQLAFQFGSQSDDHVGELYIRMHKQLGRLSDAIKNPRTFVSVNARHHHRNVLCELAGEALGQGDDE